MIIKNKPLRFIWRMSRNSLCLLPFCRRLLFPQENLAARFGRGDAEYAWSVFNRHFNRLRRVGFESAQWILEVGPGRNLGTALLWWAYLSSKKEHSVSVICWDVFKNASPEESGYCARLSDELLATRNRQPLENQETDTGIILPWLEEVAAGHVQPQVLYRVEPLTAFESFSREHALQFDLNYSQAAIEHIWHIERFWEAMIRLTRVGGLHSHRIDLADHGRRDNNYIEMLQWSWLTYWLTMRFIPGATNRWRAWNHLNKLETLGMRIVDSEREFRAQLPIPQNLVASEFRNMDEEELRTTALDVVALKA